ncbi:hypothetical protein [Rhodoferax sp.]|uniref:hypothetical protein n=1 Tax=Rhodoferax sp. TaxID=50421 RepID=UPI00262372EA|nr:hypothetical protein [Rhodoferax sp.]MDD2808083.1 hypothetical protein [Rhodoferax sp.]MDD4944441.1 hypothetical protein [Rhodoferax sp.]
MQDTRCCGTGTCLIDIHGRCWCGQQWDGDRMCHPTAPSQPMAGQPATLDDTPKAEDTPRQPK